MFTQRVLKDQNIVTLKASYAKENKTKPHKSLFVITDPYQGIKMV